VAGHHPAGEEVLGDPVGRVVDVEAVGRASMAEDMQEQQAVGLEPAVGRVSRARQLDMCSNISTETTRSKRWLVSKSFMSAVTTVRLSRPRASARAR
jgi:hypothetical protein